MSKPEKAEKICISLSKKISENFKTFDLILSPAMGGIIVGYEIGKILKKETIFSERVNGEFTLRRDFSIKKIKKYLLLKMLLLQVNQVWNVQN